MEQKRIAAPCPMAAQDRSALLADLWEKLLFSAKRMDELGLCLDGTPLTAQQEQAMEGFYKAIDICRSSGLSRREVYDLLIELLNHAELHNTDVICEEVTLLTGWCAVNCIPQLRFWGEPEDDAALIDYVRNGQWKTTVEP